MPSFLDLLKYANAHRNKQAHRMTSDSKRGKQFISDPNKFIMGQGNPIGNNAEEPKPRRTDSKTDI